MRGVASDADAKQNQCLIRIHQIVYRSDKLTNDSQLSKNFF